MSKLRKPKLSKKKGVPPSKREQAQMLALHDLDLSNYRVGEIMGRSPHTIKRYCESPMFTDPKFQKLVEEYKSKELIDLTAMNIEARARIHDLIPTMTPIEAVAVMDKSFQQRRLVEGKSTENIFSLRRIIEDAHGANRAQMPASPAQEEHDAIEVWKQSEDDQQQYQHGNEARQATEAGRSDSDEQSGQIAEEKEKAS